MKPKKPDRKTVGQKIDYLMECLDDFDIDHIRYCEFSTSHLIVNYKQKRAYLVHDPGTVVNEISFEVVNYDKAVKIYAKYLKGFELEKL